MFLCDVLYDIIIESGPIGTGLLFLAAERVSACISSRSLVFLQEHRQGILLRTMTVRLLLCLTAGFLLWRLVEYVKFFLPLIPAGLWIFREKIWEALPGWRRGAEPLWGPERRPMESGLAEKLRKGPYRPNVIWDTLWAILRPARRGCRWLAVQLG